MCENCGKSFKFLSVLKEHALSHIESKLTKVQCDICGNWAKNTSALRKHKYLHDQQSKKCPHCDKIKPNENALKCHIRISHSAPKHQCIYCDKAFSRPKALRV